MEIRSIESARTVWGAALLLAPRVTLRHVHDLPADTPSVAIARVLGARQVAQAATCGLAPSRQLLALGVFVDVAHAATGFALAAADRSRARGGLTDAMIALAFAGAGYRDLTRGKYQTTARRRRRDRVAQTVLGLIPGGGALTIIGTTRAGAPVTKTPGTAGTALIVGGSSGIGLASARELLGRGYRVVLLARDADRLSTVAAQLGPGASSAAADILDADAVTAAVDAVVAEHGTLDVVVHAAQVMAYGRIEDVPAEIFERTVETSTHGTANLARAVLPVFRSQQAGSLIIVNSLLGHIAVPGMGTYVTSKWAQLAMIRTLQLETRDAPGIQVTEVSPGAIDTPIYEQAANFSGRTPAPPLPVLAPAAMARAVADAVDNPRRHIDVGPANKIAMLGFRALPWVYDAIVGPLAKLVVFRGPDVPGTEGNVNSPAPGREAERGGWSVLGIRKKSG